MVFFRRGYEKIKFAALVNMDKPEQLDLSAVCLYSIRGAVKLDLFSTGHSPYHQRAFALRIKHCAGALLGMRILHKVFWEP